MLIAKFNIQKVPLNTYQQWKVFLISQIKIFTNSTLLIFPHQKPQSTHSILMHTHNAYSLHHFLNKFTLLFIQLNRAEIFTQIR